MFSHLILNDTVTEEWKYVRDVAPEFRFANESHQFGKMTPQSDIFSSDITCGRSAFKSAGKARTADVVAGQQIGFKVSEDYDNGLFSKRIFRTGPVQIYMSRPPNDDLTTYSGVDGEWFKVYYLGPTDNRTWGAYMASTVNFTIPATTPPGPYLVRIEQFDPNGPAYTRYNEWYINCAQINLISEGGGDLSTAGKARFPGSYKYDDPGLAQPPGNPPGYGGDLLTYRPPGPGVWQG